MKAAELQSKLKELVEETEKANQSELVRNYLNFCSMFHEYSIYNIFSIFFYYPKATRVAGFRTWQKLGRTVRKGEKGIPILAPLFFKETVKKAEGRRSRRGIVDAEGLAEAESLVDEDDVEEEIEKIYFKVVYVFDVSQTEGEPLPEVDISVKGDDSGLLAILEEIAKENSIEIKYVELEKNHLGTSKKGQIDIAKDMENAGKTVTLIHELAHEFLHKKSNNKSREVKEAEAEAIAYVVAKKFGIGTNSATYLALWDCKEKIMEVFEEIKGTTDYILNEIEKRYENSFLEGVKR